MTSSKIQFIQINDTHEGQRIDNFLFTFCKGVPKSRIYRAIRDGEVRVNKKRIKPLYRLQCHDQIRIPPFRVSEDTVAKVSTHQQERVAENIIFEDNTLIILNKPAGMAVHGGSGIQFGVIETIRQLRPQAKLLELVHRLDRDTSGCLMIAKKRSMLVTLHEYLREGKVRKVYLALVKGQWEGGTRKVSYSLQKNQLSSGERIVKVNDEGKPSVSIFEPLQQLAHGTLMKITLQTGRTHQIRVHAAHIGHPIAGDEKYGDKEYNRFMRQQGLKRLFLHAAEINFYLPEQQYRVAVCALMDADLKQFITQ